MPNEYYFTPVYSPFKFLLYTSFLNASRVTLPVQFLRTFFVYHSSCFYSLAFFFFFKFLVVQLMLCSDVALSF